MNILSSAPRVEIYYLYKLNVCLFVFSLFGILKVLIGQVATGEKKKLTVERLSTIAVKPMNDITINSWIISSMPST